VDVDESGRVEDWPSVFGLERQKRSPEPDVYLVIEIEKTPEGTVKTLLTKGNEGRGDS